MSNLDDIKKACQFHKEAYNKAKKEGKMAFGSPYSITLNGDISAETIGRVACGINSNIDGEFGVVEPETKELLNTKIDLNQIQSL